MAPLSGFASPHARAILWAQFRTLRNRLPLANKLGLAFTAAAGLAWYSMFAVLAVVVGALLSNSSQMETIGKLLPDGLFLVFLYWLIVPALLASKGSSLDIRKLLVYPIPTSEFFRLEMLLRLTAAIEVLIVIAGAFFGLLFNSAVPHWGPLALLVFILFTMSTALGFHDILGRLMARKGVREIVALLFILTAALPQFLVSRRRVPGSTGGRGFESLGAAASWAGWPWSAAARLAEGHADARAAAILLAWTAAAWIFGRLQFERTLRFDASAAGASPAISRRTRFAGWFFTWPNVLFADPLAAMVEKEIRFLTRASRFRTLFVMGFSFGLLIWWPLAFGRHGQDVGFMARNYVAVVSLYAILLLSDALLWNVFGMDRSAAQLYFVAPVETAKVLLAKNIAALFFILLETTIAAVVCRIVRLPISPAQIAEAYAVTFVATLFLVSIGNITSFYAPRLVDPTKPLRASRSGRIQVMMLVVYPVVAVPLALAYLARYAFDSEAAFFGVIALAAIFGVVVYRIALSSAVQMAETRREAILSALTRGEGLVES